MTTTFAYSYDYYDYYDYDAYNSYDYTLIYFVYYRTTADYFFPYISLKYSRASYKSNNILLVA